MLNGNVDKLVWVCYNNKTSHLGGGVVKCHVVRIVNITL